MDQKVFISHSQKDKNIADIICSTLESEGIGCWIAPRDIPYGNDWANEITTAIENCEVFVFILSKNSNHSRQCPKEISIADQVNKPIICVKIDDVEMNPGFRYHLTLQQTMFIDMSIIDKKLVSIVEAVQKKLNKRELANTDMNYMYNIDTELDHHFNEMFNKKDIPGSKAKEKLVDLQKKHFFSDFVKHLPSSSNDQEDETSENTHGDNYDYEYDKDTLEYSNETKEYLNGRYFSIPILPDMKMAAFQICGDVVDYRSQTKCIAFKVLDYTIDEDEGCYDVYVERVDPKGFPLVILYVDFAKARVFMNVAIMFYDTIRISKEPTFLNFTKDQSIDVKNIVNDRLYSKLSSDYEASKEELSKLDEHWASADISLSPAIVIDLETALPVQREIYYDEKNMCDKSRMKLSSKKRYFAMKVSISGTNQTNFPLSLLEKGKYYRNGYHGFPKSLISAIDCLEEDGSAEALYEISLIFDREDECKDTDTYFDYLMRSIDGGCKKALIEMVLVTLFKESSKQFSTDYFEMLKNSIDEKSDVGNFVIGYILESRNDQDAFDYYVKSARNMYRPALVRLQCKSNEIYDLSTDEIYKKYMEGKEKYPGLSDYCMGKICYYGINMEPHKQIALKFLKKAADLGDIDAQYFLFEIYNDELQDTEIAIQWLENVAIYDAASRVKLANWYLDGIGCEKSNENDSKAFNLLKSLEHSNNKLAINNLGWMMKYGRGCPLDYVKAKTLFERAIILDSSSAYYNLGTLYENGLGVEKDISKAIELYEIASQKGSKKAGDRLKVINGDE